MLKIVKTKFVCIKLGEKMKKNIRPTKFQNILIWTGLALLLTALFIVIAKPQNINLFLTPYSGSQIFLSKILTLIGCLSTTTGYTMINNAESTDEKVRVKNIGEWKRA